MTKDFMFLCVCRKLQIAYTSLCLYNYIIIYCFVVQSLRRVPLFVALWTIAHQGSLSFTISWSLLKLMSIGAGDAIQPSHPRSPPSPPAFSLSQHQGLFPFVYLPMHKNDTVPIQLKSLERSDYCILVKGAQKFYFAP